MFYIFLIMGKLKFFHSEITENSWFLFKFLFPLIE